MSAIELFHFGDQRVRVVLMAGEPWFVLADLCRVLSLGNAAMVARRLDEDMKGVNQIDTPGGRQSVTTVSEAGMYEVVIRSDKPEAAAFRRWITSDVLPAIRKTGSYGTPALDPLSVEGAIQLVQAAQTALAALAVAQPKADSWDQLADASGTYTVTDAGKLLASAGCPTGPRKIFEQLRELGWIFKRGGIWTGMQDKINAGLLAEYAGSHFHPRTGERVLDAPTVRVTVTGLGKLREFFGGAEPLPMLGEVA